MGGGWSEVVGATEGRLNIVQTAFALGAKCKGFDLVADSFHESPRLKDRSDGIGLR